MINHFTIDQLAKSETVDLTSIKSSYKLQILCKFLEMKSSQPKLTQKHFSKQLDYSDSTIKRYRDDIQMDSPYNKNSF